MGAPRITESQKATFWAAFNNGASIRRAAAAAGFSESTAKGLLKKPQNGQDYVSRRREQSIPDVPVPLDDVCDEAKEALTDRTGYLFCKRYFGYELSPFQQAVWQDLEDAWDSPNREYLCLNAPPGLGKSTVVVMFAAKRIVLNRAIRILFISRAHSLAARNTGRLRRALERASTAVGAASTLSHDFGRFRPRQGGDIWKREEYVVEQMDGSPIEEKEPTVAAFGFDAEWIGNRIDLLLGDDLDSTRSTRNMEVVEGNREVYDGELEPRIEGGGLLALTQQRLGAFDFSAHVLAKVILPDDDGTGDDIDGEPMYRHVIYKVHYDDLCQGVETHRHDAPAYPDGCLLDPRRMPWRDVRKAMNNPARFKIVYQQEDAGANDALVQKIWVDGGRGTDGIMYLGCLDRDRGAWELPRRSDGSLGLDGPVAGYITVDPSPTKYWSIQAWVHHPASEQRFLLDLHRERMEAPDFLEWSHGLGEFTGIADDWWHNFRDLGVPLRYIIVERNAAQRFMLQYEFFQRWLRLRGVQLIAHDTNRNKADADYGVQMLGPVWRDGRVRLPAKQGNPGRIAMMRLVDEVLRYPHSSTDDCVMGQWFLEHNLVQLARRTAPRKPVRVDPRRPSWAA